jgi:hypothetical protein
VSTFPGFPSPEQIGAYLESHGWHFARPMKQPGKVYAMNELSDSGEPIELFVPHGEMEWEDAASMTFAVVETLRAFERRSKEAVMADLLGTNVEPRAAESVA